MIPHLLRKLVETLNRPGLLGAVGMRREKACTRDVATYFRALGERLPIETLAQLAITQHKDAALHSSELIIKTTLRQMRPALVSLLSSHKMLAWKEGYNNAHIREDSSLKEAAKPKAKISTRKTSLDKLGTTGERAADYAATSSAETVVGIDNTTLDRLQNAISTGIDERLGVGGTGRLIRNLITDMSVKRAEDIASTEMNDAFSQAALEKMNDLGIEYKQSIPVDDPCDDCQENADAGPIPIDDEFPSGDDASPFHTRCRCATVGARPPQEDS